jgi:predicted RNA-binding protein with PIN domain
MPFLIDGHNVIAMLPDIDLADPHDEVKLLMRLRLWAWREDRQAVVVFDGGIPGGPSRELSRGGLEVVFAARGYTDADSIIHERLQRLPDPGNWTVVSSDHEVLDAAARVGARAMTSQDFAEALNAPPAEQRAEKPQKISADDVAYWLDVFESLSEVPKSESEDDGFPEYPAPRPLSGRTRRQRGKRRMGRRPPVSRISSTIGAQMGESEWEEAREPDRPSPKPSPSQSQSQGKPDAVSDTEVAAWLEVFGEAESDGPPPPDLKKKPPRRPKPKPSGPLTIKKETEETLSYDEVAQWMKVFGGEMSPAAPEEAASSGPPPVQGETPSSTLIEQKRKVEPFQDEEEEEDTLSDEDLALWHRLYGDGA